jgi:predicted PurR-regulated permease PerM
MVNKILNSNGFKRILIFLFVSLVLFALRDMINLILFTFIFGFLMDRLVQFIHERVSLNRKLIVVLSYVIIVGLLSLGLVKYMPVVIREIT